MSVLFLPPPSAASIPDATETTSGKIRIATSAEATAGTNDVTAMTPAKVKTVVDAAVVGGVQYQGTFDASSPADLSNAEKGDLYIISVAGSYQGKDWSIGDHLLINADMGGTLDPNKIDKVDNTDAVTSVAGRTGAVTLSTADISGLATVASTGAYSDLTGTPTLATVATTGAYSDLTGTPTNVSAFTNDAGYLTDITGENISDLADVTITTPSNGEGLIYSSGIWINGSPSVGNLDDIGDVDTTGVADTNVLKYDSATSTWVDGVVNYSEVSGTPTLATVATTGAYSDLTGTPTLGTAAALDVGTSANNVVQLDGTAKLPAVDGSQLTNVTSSVANIDDIGDVDTTGVADTNVLKYDSATSTWVDGVVAYSEVSGTPTLATVATTGAYSDLTGTPTLATVATTGAYSDLTGTPTLGTAAALDVGTSANNVVQLDGTAKLPAVDGSQLTNVTSSVGNLDDIGDVDTTGVADTNVLKYDSATSTWVDGVVNYSEVSGTPTLATVATTGAYSDLTGTPTLGTAAALDVGTSANNVVQLDGSARLPAVDGSQLTGISFSAPSITSTSTGVDQTLTGPTGLREIYIYNSTANFIVNLVSAATCGAGFQYDIKNTGTFSITVDPASTQTIDGSATYVMSIQNSTLSIMSDGSNWFIV